MKTVFLNFEFFSKGQVKPNTCIVKITPGPEPVINNVGFKDPIHNISYAQLLDLNEQIHNTVLEFTEESAETALIISGKSPSLVSIFKDPNSARSMAEKMALSLDKQGKLSTKDKELVSSAFDIIGKLFGPKVKK